MGPEFLARPGGGINKWNEVAKTVFLTAVAKVAA
jgi:hypothetical protein